MNTVSMHAMELLMNEHTAVTAQKRGDIIKRRSSHMGIPYYMYVPKTPNDCADLLVTVHGISRNARQHMNYFKEYADTYNLALVAPLFKKQSFSGYQYMGGRLASIKSDEALNDILNDIASIINTRHRKFYLFGYSGGGQFAHRYAMAHPEKIQKLFVGAAGWYTLPTHGLDYPLGTYVPDSVSESEFEAERYLQIPTRVIVGNKDTRRNKGLNLSRKIDQAQGRNRLERARNWVAAMKHRANVMCIKCDIQLLVLPGCRHSFEDMALSPAFMSFFHQEFANTTNVVNTVNTLHPHNHIRVNKKI